MNMAMSMKRGGLPMMMNGSAEKASWFLSTAMMSAWRVTDRDAFVRWMQSNRPEAVVMVPTVVPAFEAAILKDPVTEDGEVPDGIEETTGSPVLQVRPTPEARALAVSRLTKELT